MSKTRLLSILLFSTLSLLGPFWQRCQAQEDDRVVRWLQSMGQLWSRVNVEDKAVIYRRIYLQRKRFPKDARRGAKILAQSDKDETRRKMWKELSEPLEKPDPFESPVHRSISELLESHDQGSVLEQTVNYCKFLRALDKEKGTMSTALRRLQRKFPKNPWVAMQFHFAKKGSTWKYYRQTLTLIEAPKNIDKLKRCDYLIEWTEYGLGGWRGPQTTENKSRLARAWVLRSESEKKAKDGKVRCDLFCDDLGEQGQEVELKNIRSFESEIFERLGTGIKKPKATLEPSFRTPLTLPSETLLMAYYADLRGQKTLAYRMFEFAEHAFKKLNMKGSLHNQLRKELVPYVQGQLNSRIVHDSYRNQERYLRKIIRSMKDTPLRERALKLRPFVKEMIKEKRPKTGSTDADRLKQAVFDIRNQRSETVGLDSSSVLNRKSEAYQAFSKLGLKSVPTLIKLLDDPRPTRAYQSWKLFPIKNLNYAEVVNLYLEELLSYDFDLEVSEGKNLNGLELKAAAQKYWENYGDSTLLGHCLKLIKRETLIQTRSIVATIVKDEKARAAAKADIQRHFKKVQDPYLREDWFEIIIPYSDLGLDSEVKKELNSDDLDRRLHVARLLWEHRKDKAGVKAVADFLTKNEDKAEKVIENSDIREALLFLRDQKVENWWSLAQTYSVEGTKGGVDLIEVLESEKDSPALRRFLARLAAIPRLNKGRVRLRLQTLRTGREYADFAAQDSAAILLASLFKVSEDQLFPKGKSQSAKKRDKLIRAFLESKKLFND